MVSAWIKAASRRLGLAPLPPPRHGFFPVKSHKQLVWLVSHGRNFFFLYGAHGGRLALSVWPKKGGLLVCHETSARQWFLPHRRFAKSVLGRAVAEKRLFVDWFL